MEHSDRGKYVTELVSTWICNDGAFYNKARNCASRGVRSLECYILYLLRDFDPPLPTPLQVAQELAPNDYNRIDWQSIADDLLQE